MHVVVVMCVLCGCEVITDMTKLCVHVFTTSSDAENYCHQVETTWCEAVTKMQLVIVCTPCEGKATVEWTYNEVTLNETSAQLTFPPDKVVMSASGCYRCSCQGSNGEAAFAVEMRSAGVCSTNHMLILHRQQAHTHKVTNTLTSTISCHLTCLCTSL